MQRIERYGVIALVFLLVTILAVAVWGQRKNQSLLSFLKRDKAATEVANVETPASAPLPSPDSLGFSSPSYQPQPTTPLAPQGNLANGGVVLADAPIVQPGGPGAAAVTFDHGDLLPTAGGASSGFIEAQNQLNVAVLPAPSGPRTYVVKNGDTLGTIAQRELGSTKRWKEIEALNGVKPERLAVGMTLKLPAGSAVVGEPLLARTQPEPKTKQAPTQAPKSSARTYTVRAGDSLSKIASAQLGNADRHGEILALNPGVKADKLAVGQVLRLPASAVASNTSAKVAPRPRSDSSTVAKAVSTPKKARVQ